MSELMNARNADLRSQLLMTASALALLTCVFSAQDAEASDHDSDRPTVWIELGGQLERVDGGQEQVFAPPFIAANATSPAFAPITPLAAQNAPRYDNGAEGKISFTPENSDWVFSASIRYGRSNGSRHIHQQTPGTPVMPSPGLTLIPNRVIFADVKAKHDANYAILDFEAGKDMGLGLFSREGSSTLSFGVRVAQLSSRSAAQMNINPNYHFPGTNFKYPINSDLYMATARSTRSFHGIGPSLSWNASQPVVGNSEAGEITFDWGAKAAILFGRQKASGHHQVTNQHYYARIAPLPKYFHYSTPYHHATDHNRSRSVVVPNVGGFAGISFHYSSAKLSFGYRGDFFFGAMDTGIDVAKRTTTGFHGPFANVSIGLGG